MKSFNENNRFKFLIITLIVVHFISFSIYTSDLIYYLKFITPLFIIINWYFDIGTKIKFKKNEITIYIYIFLLSINILISYFNNGYQSILESLVQGLSYVILLIMAFVIIPEYVSDEEDYINYLKLFLKTLLFLFIISIIMTQLNPALGYTNFNNRLRYRGIFENPNSLGFFSMLGIIISTTLFSLLKNKGYLIINVFLFILIYASDSKTSLITSVIYIILSILLYGINSNKKLIRGSFKFIKTIIITAIFLSIIFAVFNFNNISLEYIDSIMSNRVSRSIYSVSDLNTIDYIFGKGIGTRISNPHNAIINTLIELGIIGLVISYSLILYLLINFKLLKKNKNNKNKLILNSGITTGIVFIIFGLSESVFITLGNIVSFYVWSSFGIILSLYKNVLQEK